MSETERKQIKRVNNKESTYFLLLYSTHIFAYVLALSYDNYFFLLWTRNRSLEHSHLIKNLNLNLNTLSR